MIVVSARVARAVVLFLVAVASTTGTGSAQHLSLLDSNEVHLIAEEISGDASYEHVRFMTQFHRPVGSNNLWAVAEYYERKAREIGLEDVRIVKQRSTRRPWNARSAELWITKPRPERIASTLQAPVHLADNSRAVDTTVELVDGGGGTAGELDARRVAGRLVLTHGPLEEVMQRAVIERGAVGLVWYPSPFRPGRSSTGAGLARPDQIAWLSLSPDDTGSRHPTFAFVLSASQGVDLSGRLAPGQPPVTVRAVVDAAFTSEQGSEPWQVMVEAVIRGTEPGLNQDIVLTGHLQEGPRSANDDGSGCANVLEIARALKRLIDDGRIRRPRRTLRFWWVTEFGSERQYFADDPELVRRLWVNINQDMVGADQSQGVLRKQNITRLPATRFHFFNDVMEAVVEYVVAGNTMEVAQTLRGYPLYPKPHLAHLGSRHRYNAESIFFHTFTDNGAFLEAPIGMPAITLTNWPDQFIHSTDDDLWNIDRSQLGRNALTAALISYIMAQADSGSLPGLTAETVGRGRERLGRNLRLALSWIATGTQGSRALDAAREQIRYAAERERRAIQSLAEVEPRRRSLLRSETEQLDRARRDALGAVETAYRRASPSSPRPGAAAADGAAPSDAERRLGAIRPALMGGPREFLPRRYDAQRAYTAEGLHFLMGFEVLNAVNGARTGLDIYRLVAAEAREAGDHYYGTVKPEQVLACLQQLAASGVIRWSGPR
jgi:hypothetical protein